MGEDRHRVTTVVVMVPFIRPDICVVSVGLEACLSDTDGRVSSSNDIGLSRLVYPPPDVTGSFPIITVV